VAAADPAPLSARQARALAAGAARELGWGSRAVRAEVARWRRRALAIEDPVGRARALDALADKRLILEGAALFWTLPRRRDPALLRLLVAFQILANFHDHASEQAARAGRADALGGSMDAFLEVVDVDRPLTSYGGPGTTGLGAYLRELAEACRSRSAALPRYRLARPLLLREASRARALDLEHDPDAPRRVRRLRALAAGEYGDPAGVPWWELTAGATSMLTVIVLLALAADERTTADDLRHAAEAYGRVGSASAFLDSYVDRREDAAAGGHNYLSYYATPAAAASAVADLVEGSLRAARDLALGERHVLIVASMTAMYLSSDGARDPALRAVTRTLARRGGTLTRLLIPVLRGWRMAYRQTQAC
jgi:tetraprenyl-beta-curcumene synthase